MWAPFPLSLDQNMEGWMTCISVTSAKALRRGKFPQAEALREALRLRKKSWSNIWCRLFHSLTTDTTKFTGADDTTSR